MKILLKSLLVLFLLPDVSYSAVPCYSSPIRRLAGTGFMQSNQTFSSKRFFTSGISSRPMKLPEAPSWLLSHSNQSTHAFYSNDFEAIDQWKPVYNEVDDVLLHVATSTSRDRNSTSDLEIHLPSAKPMHKIQDYAPDVMNNTRPFCATGRVQSHFRVFTGKEELKVVGTGSAVAVSPFIALTVAHNFLPQNLTSPNIHKIKAHEVLFQLQFDGTELEGTSSSSVAGYYIHDKWANGFNPDYDIAVIFFSPSLSGKKNESYVVPYINQGCLIDQAVRVVGYPAEIPHIPNKEQGRYMYVSDGKIIENSENLVHYDATTYKGNSGGPVVIRQKEAGTFHDSEKLIALHTSGSQRALRNTGVRFSPDTEDFIHASLEKLSTSHRKRELIPELIAQHYSDLKPHIGEPERELISGMENTDQARRFLDYLRFIKSN